MPNGISRRSFLKLTGATTGGLLLPAAFLEHAAAAQFPLHKSIGEGRTICPFCAAGCGLLVATDDGGHIVNVEGDPDHVTNRGALDSKPIALHQLSGSSSRLTKVMYRAPYSAQWEEKDWDWALRQVADRVKATREATFVGTDAEGVKVNRTEGLAFLGGAANNTEEAYLAVKLMRALGLVRIEHAARI